MKFFCALLALLCLPCAAPLWAANYFVTESGAGLMNGTSAANAWSVAQYNASAAPTGGDTVYFSGAISSTLTIPTSGTGNGASRLTLDFTGSCAGCIVVTFAPSITANLIDFNNHNFLTFNGGGNGTLGGAGATWIVASGSPNMFMCKLPNGTAENAHDITVNGFTYIGTTTGKGDFYQNGLCTFITITNNYVDNVGHFVNSYQGAVHDITILNNFGRTSLDSTSDDDVIQMGGAQNVIIQGNKLVNRAPGSGSCCHNDVIQTYGVGQSPSNWIIRYNWIEAAQATAGGSGSGDQLTEIQGFTGQPALQVYGNVFVDTLVTQPGGNEGISIHSGTNASDTYYFYNNTVWAHQWPTGDLVRLGEGDGPGTVFIENNAVGSDLPTNPGWQVTFTIGAASHNFDYQATSCPASCSALTPSAFTNISIGCSAVNCSDNFSQSANSVLLNAGDSTIGSAYNQGICPGATWPNPTLCQRSPGSWDVGAFQQGTTIAVNPPSNLSVTVQ